MEAASSLILQQNPGADLHRLVRAGLLLRGVTLSQWCKEEGESRQYVYQCLTGRRGGQGAMKVLNRLAALAHLP